MRRGILLALGALLVAAGCLVVRSTGVAGAADDQRTVRVATLSAAIDPVTANWVVEQIHRADRDRAAAFVLELDTPGGLSTSMDDIVQAELAAKLPVVVYVWPPGGRAASAGFVILQGADVAAMVSASNTGSATPISGSGENVGSDLRGKVINDAVAKVRNLAETHHRNADAAERAVRPYNAKTCRTCPENYTASEALKLNVIDDVAPDLTTLLDRIDGRKLVYKDLTVSGTANARIERRELPIQDRLLQILIDPNLIILLFLGGLAGIVFELTHPGIVLPGLLGVVSLILALFGLSVVPFSWAGVALVLIGVALLAAEAHVPTSGAFAAVGVLALTIGGIMLFRVDGSPYEASLPLVLTITLVLAAATMLVLQRTLAARRAPVMTGVRELVGSVARVTTPLAPRGQVLVHGERWAAVAEPPYPEPGADVRVASIDGLVLHVEPTASPAQPDAPLEQGV